MQEREQVYLRLYIELKAVLSFLLKSYNEILDISQFSPLAVLFVFHFQTFHYTVQYVNWRNRNKKYIREIGMFYTDR